MVHKLFALSALAATTAYALPEVTVKQLPAGCSSYPSYNAATGETDGFLVQVVDSDNPAIEGFYDTSDYSVGIGAQGRPYMRWGYLTIPTDNQVAKTGLKCFDGALHAWVDTELTPAGAPTSTQWAPLALSPYVDDGVLLYKVSGEEVRLYEHYVGDEKQEGLFLGGYDNSTTWGFKYISPGPTAPEGNYQMRLLRGNEVLGANETAGFVKVQGS